MSRPLRIQYPGAWYHVMNRGAGRKPVYLKPKHYHYFLDLLIDLTERFRVEIHSYCLMENHYHLLLHTPIANLSRAMRHLDGVYTQRYNKDIGTDGALFRGRYKSILIDADSYLLQLSRYIHLNPVKAKLVDVPEAYCYSSYKDFIDINIRAPWVQCEMLLGRLSGRDKIRAYIEFVNQGIDQNIAQLFARKKLPAILGGEDFIDGINAIWNEKALNHEEIPEGKAFFKFLGQPSLETIRNVISDYYGVDGKDFSCKEWKSELAIARNMLVHIGILFDYKLKDIANKLGEVSYHAISKMHSRFKTTLAQSDQLAKDLDKMQNQIINMSNV